MCIWSSRHPRALAAAGVIGLALAAVAPAGAANIVTGGGFESGVLDPWSAERSFDPEGAGVIAPGRTDGFALVMDGGEFDDFYHVEQDLPPTPVGDITEVSLWALRGESRFGVSPALVFTYTDGSSSQQLFGFDYQWGFVDATAALSPGKVLSHLDIWWDGLGDEGPSAQLMIDDVTVNAVPAPGAGLGMVFAAALGLRSRRRR
jgi:hypothetical protein